MGVIHEAFRADPDALGAFELDSGPGSDGVPAVGILELVTLEALLADEESDAAGVPEALAYSDEAWLFPVPERLSRLLRQAGSADLTSVVRRWVETDELEDWSEPDAQGVADGLAALAKEALAAGQRLYLWGAL